MKDKTVDEVKGKEMNDVRVQRKNKPNGKKSNQGKGAGKASVSDTMGVRNTNIPNLTSYPQVRGIAIGNRIARKYPFFRQMGILDNDVELGKFRFDTIYFAEPTYPAYAQQLHVLEDNWRAVVRAANFNIRETSLYAMQAYLHNCRVLVIRKTVIKTFLALYDEYKVKPREEFMSFMNSFLYMEDNAATETISVIEQNREVIDRLLEVIDRTYIPAYPILQLTADLIRTVYEDTMGIKRITRVAAPGAFPSGARWAFPAEGFLECTDNTAPGYSANGYYNQVQSVSGLGMNSAYNYYYLNPATAEHAIPDSEFINLHTIFGSNPSLRWSCGVINPSGEAITLQDIRDELVQMQNIADTLAFVNQMGAANIFSPMMESVKTDLVYQTCDKDRQALLKSRYYYGPSLDYDHGTGVQTVPTLYDGSHPVEKQTVTEQIINKYNASELLIGHPSSEMSAFIQATTPTLASGATHFPFYWIGTTYVVWFYVPHIYTTPVVQANQVTLNNLVYRSQFPASFNPDDERNNQMGGLGFALYTCPYRPTLGLSVLQSQANTPSRRLWGIMDLCSAYFPVISIVNQQAPASGQLPNWSGENWDYPLFTIELPHAWTIQDIYCATPSTNYKLGAQVMNYLTALQETVLDVDAHQGRLYYSCNIININGSGVDRAPAVLCTYYGFGYEPSLKVPYGDVRLFDDVHDQYLAIDEFSRALLDVQGVYRVGNMVFQYPDEAYGSLHNENRAPRKPNKPTIMNYSKPDNKKYDR